MNKINFIYLRSIVGNDPSFKDKERAKFLAELNKNNDFIFDKSGENIFFIETGGTEEQFKSLFSAYKEPYILVATDANNSLPASLEIASYLRNNNKKFKLIHGTPEEVRNQLKSKEKPEICGNCKGFLKTNVLHGMRFGVIGHPSDWLIASDVDYNDVKEKLGVTLVDISSEEFLSQIEITNNKIDSTIFESYLNEKVNKDTLDGAIQIYSALLDIITKYKLDGLTVRCFDLLDTVKNTSCLALAMLNKEGYIATCEGDIPTMLSMAIIKKTCSESSFQVNPSYINVDKRIGYFAHCTIPLDMCSSYEFDTHFESGIGIGIKGQLRLSDITIFKMNANLNNYEIFEGKVLENLSKINLCRTQVKIMFNEPIEEIISLPNGNHLVIFYGLHKEKLVKILSN